VIFDWVANSEKILQEGKLTSGDRFDRKSYRKQQICLAWYLTSQLGMSVDKAYSEWRRVMMGSGKKVRLSMDDRETNKYNDFLDLVGQSPDPTKKKSNNRLPSSKYTTRRTKNIHVYESEIDKIASLEAPKWYREWVLAILMLYKFQCAYHEPKKISDGFALWAYEKAKNVHGNKRTQMRRDTGRLYRKCIPFAFGRPNTDIAKGSLYFDWAVSEGKEAFSFYTPDECMHWFWKIPEWTAKCPSCGREFVVTERRKSSLCPMCSARRNRTGSKKPEKLVLK
jgi:hypothetical protein